jgi:hypothetical protein
MKRPRNTRIPSLTVYVDVLTITVWKERELSGSVVVRPDGAITLPLIDDVRVVGLTPQELVVLIAEKLKPFVNLPQVTVDIEAKQPPDPRKWRMLPPERPRQLPPLWPFVVTQNRAR